MKTFHWREALERFLMPGNLAPYLLVPPMLAGLIGLETGGGVLSTLISVPATPDPILAKYGLVLWNAAAVTSLVAGLTGASFFSRTFGSPSYVSILALPAGRSSAYWSAALIHAFIASIVYTITFITAVSALHPPSAVPLIPIYMGGFSMVLWSCSISCLAGMLTSPAGAALLFVGAGVSAMAAPWGSAGLITPPLTRVLASATTCLPDWTATASLAAHAVLAALSGWLLFLLAIRGGWIRQ